MLRSVFGNSFKSRLRLTLTKRVFVDIMWGRFSPCRVTKTFSGVNAVESFAFSAAATTTTGGNRDISHGRRQQRPACTYPPCFTSPLAFSFTVSRLSHPSVLSGHPVSAARTNHHTTYL